MFVSRTRMGQGVALHARSCEALRPQNVMRLVQVVLLASMGVHGRYGSLEPVCLVLAGLLVGSCWPTQNTCFLTSVSSAPLAFGWYRELWDVVKTCWRPV